VALNVQATVITLSARLNKSSIQEHNAGGDENRCLGGALSGGRKPS
jgi:hypothetical protein